MHKRFGILVAVVVTAFGCSRPNGEAIRSELAVWCSAPQTGTRTVDEAAGGGLSLRICTTSTTATPGGPIVVLVLIENRGGPVTFRNRLSAGELLRFTVTDSLGREIAPVGSPPLTQIPPWKTDVWLPHGGIIGGVVDLTCGGTDVGPPDQGQTVCGPRFRLEEVGTYQVRASYEIRCPVDLCDPNGLWMGRLEAGPLPIVVAG